jgi:hypothetical protein
VARIVNQHAFIMPPRNFEGEVPGFVLSDPCRVATFIAAFRDEWVGSSIHA